MFIYYCVRMLILKKLYVPLKLITNKTVKIKFRTSCSVSREALQNEDKGITIVTLNNPKSRNAVNKELIQDLHNTFEVVSSDLKTRVIILRSVVPRIFCAGADLKERITMKDTEIISFLKKLN